VAKSGKAAFNRAVTNAYYPPKIIKVKTDNYSGRPGDSITVQATDDFKVAVVRVTIHDANFRLIEEGDADMQMNELDWIYVVAVANESLAGSKITAMAADLPGNKTLLTVTLF
jgi:hypothetical protein